MEAEDQALEDAKEASPELEWDDQGAGEAFGGGEGAESWSEPAPGAECGDGEEPHAGLSYSGD